MNKLKNTKTHGGCAKPARLVGRKPRSTNMPGFRNAVAAAYRIWLKERGYV